jgi:outer membrane receptor protein involved in Fe transport
MSSRGRFFAIGVFTLSLGSRALNSQGIASAALQGSVLQSDSTPIPGAIVTVTAPASGARWQVVTDPAGLYFVENVQVGGPYVIEARAVGFRAAGLQVVRLGLGQRYRADFVLEPSVVELPEVSVRASVNELLNSGRTGPAHIVSESELIVLPNLARDLSVAAALGPLAVLRPLGGISIGGQNQGFNSLQVDGGVNADLYLGRTPGGASPSGALPEVIPHAISLETVSEFQVLAAPFDVRLGNFAGGLLNAVTKSGANAFHGSVFGFLQEGSLTAKDATGNRPDLASWQFGGTLSGPIVRDRVHFFLNADFQERVVPDVGFLVAADTVGGADLRKTGVSYANALRFQQILRDSFHLNPGSLGPSDGRLPAQDVFAKLTMQLSANGHLELSYHYAHGDRRDYIDTGRANNIYALSSVAGRSVSTARTSRLIWTALVGGRAQNEFILSYERLLDTCRPNGRFPLIQVRVGSGTLIAGPNSVCPSTAVNQNAFEITENLTIGAGRHVVTIGSHGELLHFHDPLVQVSAGRWTFGTLDSLAFGEARHYDVGLPDSVRPPGADFHVVTLGVYAQDQWMPTSRLTLTAGLRLDAPFLPDAARTNTTLLASPLAIDTGELPNGNVLWSPRLGANYDVTGDGTAFVRGGIGLFGGPPPYRWLGNGYRETGDETVVFCDRPNLPRFVPDGAPPTQCPSPPGVSPRISFFDPGLKLPQNLKLALGVDRRFRSGVVATIDFLYTRAVHQIYASEANLGASTGAAAGEGGRPLYGTISGTSLANLTTNPAWRDTSFGEKEIYRVSNRGGDRSFSVSAQVRKRFGGMLALYAAYAYSHARDRMSWVNFPARANFSNTPLDGTLDDRRLRRSFFDTPHKVAVAATFDLPHRLQLTLLYQGASQPPYTYVIDGDANADGVGGAGSLKNDIVYVPRHVADISMPAADYVRLDAFIEQQPCLREQRGRIMARNSCRNGWLGFLNARLAEVVPMAGGQRIEITADVFNVLNLISSRWGRYRDITTGPSVTLLTLVGWDATNERGMYRLSSNSLPARGVVDDVASRWRVQLGARYAL